MLENESIQGLSEVKPTGYRTHLSMPEETTRIAWKPSSARWTPSTVMCDQGLDPDHPAGVQTALHMITQWRLNNLLLRKERLLLEHRHHSSGRRVHLSPPLGKGHPTCQLHSHTGDICFWKWQPNPSGRPCHRQCDSDPALFICWWNSSLTEKWAW